MCAVRGRRDICAMLWIITGNIYWVLTMCQALWQALYKYLLVSTTTLYTKYYCYHPYFTDKESRPRAVKWLSQGPTANRQAVYSVAPTCSPHACSCWATLYSISCTWHCPVPVLTRVGRQFKLLLVRIFIYMVNFLHSKDLWINCKYNEFSCLLFPPLSELHKFPEPDSGHLDSNPIPSPSTTCVLYRLICCGYAKLGHKKWFLK